VVGAVLLVVAAAGYALVHRAGPRPARVRPGADVRQLTLAVNRALTADDADPRPYGGDTQVVAAARLVSSRASTDGYTLEDHNAGAYRPGHYLLTVYCAGRGNLDFHVAVGPASEDQVVFCGPAPTRYSVGLDSAGGAMTVGAYAYDRDLAVAYRFGRAG